MSNSISGSISVTSSLAHQIGASASNANPYPVPLNYTQSRAYSTGTGPKQAMKAAQAGGVTTAGTPTDIDLTAIQCSDGSTGFTHVRELALFCVDPTNPFNTGNDGVVTAPFVPFLSGTDPVLTVQPGSCHIFSNWLATTGWTTGSGAKKVRIDGGANAVAYYLLILGD